MSVEVNVPSPESEEIFETSGVYSDLLSGLLDATSRFVSERVPDILVGIAILLIGWVVAALVRRLVSRGLQALGVDLFVKRIGLSGYLERHQVNGRLSVLMGWTLYVIILYWAVLTVLGRWGLYEAESFLRTLAGLVPPLLVALVLLVIGLVVARASSPVIARTASLIGLPAPEWIAAAGRGFIYLLTALVILDYLGFASSEVLLGSLLLLVLTLLAVLVMFATFGRSLAESLLARNFLQNTYRRGDRIAFEDIEGEVESIESTVTYIRSAGGRLVIPNRQLQQARVQILTSAPPDGSKES